MFNIQAKSNNLSLLDIGSSKISCMVVKPSSMGQMDVLGFSEVESAGVRAGNIVDLAAAAKRITKVVEETEKISGTKIKKVYVNIASNNLISDICHGSIDVSGREITTRELEKLLISALDKYKDQKVNIIHSFKYDYILDGKRGIVTPLGMYGELLTCYIHALLIPSNILSNIHGCLARANLEVEGYISSSYASALACLSADEMKLGTLLIEFGGGVTSFSVFSDGHMMFTDAVGVGGLNVTNDIARALCMDFAASERIKRLHGNLLSTSKDNIEVDSSDGDEPYIVKLASLKEIIKARVDELLEFTMGKLEEREYMGISSRLVITGGAANLCSLKELLAYNYSLKVRMAQQKVLKSDKFPQIYEPSSACIVGMAIHVHNTRKEIIQLTIGKRDGFWAKIKEILF